MNTLKNDQSQLVKPLVCVRSITYNHAPYIADAMNGFCMQKTSFPFVCAVIDDCSTDGEQEVISNYLHEHFDLEDQSVVRNEETDDYKLIYARHKENHKCFFVVLYLKYNHYSIGKSHLKNQYIKEWYDSAKYIALCEGDDYWIDPLKLQKQVDYMESHPECVMCYSKANQFNQVIGKFVGEYGNDSSFDKQLFHDDIPTLTMLYRQCIYEQYQNEIFPRAKWKMGDMPLCMYFYKHGHVKFMPEVMGVYRILENSASHFANVEKAFQFMDNSLRVRLFMLDKYGSDKITKKDVAQQQLIWYLKLALKYDQEIKSFNYKAFKEQFQIYSLKNDIKFFLIKRKWGRKILGKKNQL